MEQVLRVRGLEVVDDSGQARITLGVNSDGTAAIKLNDSAGRIGVGLHALEGGANDQAL
jgi:hypothetical protein